MAYADTVFHPVEALHWLRMHLNRPDAGALDELEFWSLFEHDGNPLTAAPATLACGGELELLVVVTTYQRPESCAHVLSSLKRAIERVQPISVRILVFHDRGHDSYRSTCDLAHSLFGADLTWLNARTQLGKSAYWKTYQTSFLAARAVRPRYALYLQDDLQFAETMLVDAFSMYEATKRDPLRRVIYLYSSQADEPSGRWIRFRRVAAGEGIALTQWFDLQAFFADLAFFELLSYRLIPVHANRWRRRSSLSSGVGRQLTIRLRGRANIYQAYPPLVFHGAEPSQMNPDVRAHEPLDNRGLLPAAHPNGVPAREDS
jgi:hypothetical protein